ncbi:hypothetical protein [Dialister invisus]
MISGVLTMWNWFIKLMCWLLFKQIQEQTDYDTAETEETEERLGKREEIKAAVVFSVNGSDQDKLKCREIQRKERNKSPPQKERSQA